jgi:methyl-accepting chemotaxis protein
MIKPEQTLHRKFVISRLHLASAALFIAVTLSSTPAVFAASKDMVQLQTQIQALQDAVARLQQSNDERMGAMKDLIQQSADSINKMGANVDVMRKQLQTQQEAQGGKVDQVSGQIQSLNDSVDEIKARIATLQKLMQDVQSQQQSMSAGMPQPTSTASNNRSSSGQEGQTVSRRATGSRSPWPSSPPRRRALQDRTRRLHGRQIPARIL